MSKQFKRSVICGKLDADVQRRIVEVVDSFKQAVSTLFELTKASITGATKQTANNIGFVTVVNMKTLTVVAIRQFASLAAYSALPVLLLGQRLDLFKRHVVAASIIAAHFILALGFSNAGLTLVLVSILTALGAIVFTVGLLDFTFVAGSHGVRIT